MGLVEEVEFARLKALIEMKTAQVEAEEVKQRLQEGRNGAKEKENEALRAEIYKRKESIKAERAEGDMARFLEAMPGIAAGMAVGHKSEEAKVGLKQEKLRKIQERKHKSEHYEEPKGEEKSVMKSAAVKQHQQPDDLSVNTSTGASGWQGSGPQMDARLLQQTECVIIEAEDDE